MAAEIQEKALVTPKWEGGGIKITGHAHSYRSPNSWQKMCGGAKATPAHFYCEFFVRSVGSIISLFPICESYFW